MNGPFDTSYSNQEQQQLFTTQRPDWPTRSNSISTIYNNHETSSPNETINSLDTTRSELAGKSLHSIIMKNDKEIKRRRNLSSQFNTVDIENRYPMMTELIGENSELSDCQMAAISEQIYQEQRRSSSGAFEIASYEEIKRPISVCDPRNDVQQSIQNSNITINSNEPVQNSTEGTLDNLIFTQAVTSEMFNKEENYGLGLSSPQYSLNLDNKSLYQINNNFLMTSPQQDALLSHCDSMQYGDTSSSKQNIPITAFEKEIAASPTGNSTVNQYQTNPSSARFTDLTNVFPTQNYSFPIGPTPNLKLDYPWVKQSDSNRNNIYCQSGFDLFGALIKVSSRKNPEINIGKVDMSCAFTVCDISLYDCPIIYVSDVFENLTGYNQYEVKGQNCRFLQSPDGKVQAGAKREFVDNDSIHYLKEKVTQLREAQRIIINYRKGGQPFMNVLTIIPITGEDDVSIRYFVGFQIDLVETPTSVQGKTASSTYNVNYSHCTIPTYIWCSPRIVARQALDSGQSINREDVSTVLASLGAGTESELMKRVWDKIILENTDDVVHVLSLKGLFLYLSPSSRQVLEYDASELVGRALSAVCHPSDIVSVTRELKDTSTGIPVNVVFRIRRKNSGYTWFESRGSLCVEQGKGRKCIVLVGRERPVYALDRSEIELAGGIGESEMWNKISTSGMFLFVSSSVRNLFDRSPSELVGTSFQALMRAESKIGFGHSLEKARTGRIITYDHEILGKRGLMMQAQTTLFPGDASKGEKSTFLVARTKLIRSSPKSAQSTTTSTQMVKASSVPDGQEDQLHSSIGIITRAGSSALAVGSQHLALASESNIFVELKTTRCTAWQFELRQMEKSNRLLAEELATLLSNKKRRKRRKGAGILQRDCANCHTRVTPEWRRGPSGERDLCNSCGLRYAKQNGRVSPRNSSRDKMSMNLWSSIQSSPLRQVYCQSSMINSSQNTPSNKSFISTESSDRSIKNAHTDNSSENTRMTDFTPSVAHGIGMNYAHLKKDKNRESSGK